MVKKTDSEINAADVGADDDVLQPTPEAEPKRPKVVLSPEQIASRQRAHEIKVAKFLAGGEF